MFPLFQTVLKQTEGIDENEDMTNQEKLELAEKISKLDKPGHEYIYAIIRNYQLEFDKEDFEDLPYKVRVKKSGYKWEMQKLPKRLLIMIRHFVHLHLEKIKEESQRTTFFEKKV
jgi:putative cell wall-binding protein